jgi:hypothetical protein
VERHVPSFSVSPLYSDQQCVWHAQGKTVTFGMHPCCNLPTVYYAPLHAGSTHSAHLACLAACLSAHTQALLLVAAMSSLHNHVADMAPAVFSQLDKLPTKPDLGASGPFVHPGISPGHGCAAWSKLCWNWVPC